MNPDLLLLRGLRGAPLSVLLALRFLGRAGRNHLMSVTGYDRDAVTLALRTLGDLGFAVQVGRYNGWQLTPTAVQLPLFIPSQLAGRSIEREDGKTVFPQGGGGLLASHSELINLTTTTVSEDGKTVLPAHDFAALPEVLWPEAIHLAELLTVRLNCGRAKARAAVTAALARGEAPAHVELQLLQWASWLAVAANRQGLRYPGLFVARKLSEGEAPPAGAPIAWGDWERVRVLQAELRPGDGECGVEHEDAEATKDTKHEGREGGAAEAAAEAAALAAPNSVPADREVWEQVRAQLRLQLPRSTFESWVRDAALLRRTGDAFTVGAASPAAREWLARRLAPLIERTLRGVAGPAATVAFTVTGQEAHDGADR